MGTGRKSDAHPRTGRGEAHIDPRVLDLGHLRIYTLGSPELERELLDLFRVQMRQHLLAILGARTCGDWTFAAHTLKGAARALGAWTLAETAGEVENLGFDAAPEAKAVLVARLEADITRCEATLNTLH